MSTTLGKLLNPNDVGHDVIAILGQSNALGSGEGADFTYLDYTSPRVQQYVGDPTHPLYRQVVAAIDPLLHYTTGQTTNPVGAGVVFGREYAKTIPANRSVLLVPAARGGSGFTTADYSWDPTPTIAPTIANLYTNAVTQIRAALALSSANRLIAAIWLQGEADILLPQSAYAALLDKLIGALRTDLAAPNLPVLIGSMNPDKIAEGNAGYIAVNEAHIDTPRRLVRTWYVLGPTGAYNSATYGGTIHYNGAGQRELGRRYAAALPYARANVLSAAPVAPETVTIAQTGTALAVAWTPGKGRATTYTVQYNINGGAWQTPTRAASLDRTITITGLTLGTTVAVRVATVNEVGTSAYTVSNALALDSLPGQVTGLTAGTTGSNNQALTWAAVTGARTYLVEYKQTSSSTWLTSSTVTGAAATVIALNVSTSYDYRVTAQNNGGAAASPSATLTVTTLALQALASAVGTDPLHAYSLRKIRTAYAGAAVRVRRSSDNAETDIGFTAGGVLDQAALLTHIGAGDGYVSVFYDQGTTVANFAQATTALQPKIATAGAVEKVNGVPVVRFTGTQYLSHSAPDLFAAAAVTVFLTHTAPATAASQAVYGEDNNGVSGYYFPAYYNGAGQPTFYDGSTARVGSGLVLDGALMQQTSQDTGSALTIAINRTQKLNYSPYTPPGATVVRGRMGAYIPGTASAFYTGAVCEVAAWNSALASTPVAAGQSNQQAFYGTP